MKSLGLDQGNGFDLRRDGSDDLFDIDREFGDDDNAFMTLGWSFVNLFHL